MNCVHFCVLSVPLFICMTEIPRDKPRDANLFHFGFIRPEIFNYQMSCYQRDQDRQRAGKKLRNRIELIRVQEEEEVKQLDEELTGMLLKTQQSEHKEVELAKGKPSSRMRQVAFCIYIFNYFLTDFIIIPFKCRT